MKLGGPRPLRSIERASARTDHGRERQDAGSEAEPAIPRGFIHEYVVDNWERHMEGEKLVGWVIKVTFPTGRRGARVWHDHEGFIHHGAPGVLRLGSLPRLLPEVRHHHLAQHGEPPAARRLLPPAGPSEHQGVSEEVVRVATRQTWAAEGRDQ